MSIQIEGSVSDVQLNLLNNLSNNNTVVMQKAIDDIKSLFTGWNISIIWNMVEYTYTKGIFSNEKPGFMLSQNRTRLELKFNFPENLSKAKQYLSYGKDIAVIFEEGFTFPSGYCEILTDAYEIVKLDDADDSDWGDCRGDGSDFYTDDNVEVDDEDLIDSLNEYIAEDEDSEEMVICATSYKEQPCCIGFVLGETKIYMFDNAKFFQRFIDILNAIALPH